MTPGKKDFGRVGVGVSLREMWGKVDYVEEEQERGTKALRIDQWWPDSRLIDVAAWGHQEISADPDQYHLNSSLGPLVDISLQLWASIGRT